MAVISRVGEQTFRLIFCCQYRMLVGIDRRQDGRRDRDVDVD